jgi:hypothetical protein
MEETEMNESVLDVKARLQDRYLGRFGIHGVGVNEKMATIRFYYWPEPGVEIEPVAEKIRAEAAPFATVFIRAHRPVLL